ncbi:MAG TPA: DEAD/DEAH box helicase [Mucilaginibacter sp.]|nr:DEAD/DEAH box helicase [Mucilaginibacter sp.]
MWAEKLKLSKQLVRSVTEAGYFTPKEIQSKTLSRIIGGQDIIAVSPEGSGKTTAYILGVLMRLKYGFEEAPRALILVPNKEKVLEVIAQFELLNKNASIRVVGLYTEPSIQPQMDALADGVDIVVATPDRARAIYLKLGLNLNKIMMLVIDDAAEIVKQGAQLPVAELANSIIKCQHLVFTEVMHGKLQQMIDPFMNMPALIEVEELGEAKAEIHSQSLYLVPNFKTKLNLLTLLIKDVEEDAKVAVFVSTRLNAEKVYSHLRLSFKNEVGILNPMMFESKGYASIDEFMAQPEARVLIIANELIGPHDLQGISLLIHFEIPEDTETFVQRMVKDNTDDSEVSSVILSTDLELVLVKKIEHTISQKINTIDLPEGLHIIAEQKDKKAAKSEKTIKNEVAQRGEAFHEKKASNKKDYNYSAGTKAKMNKKKKH